MSASALVLATSLFYITEPAVTMREEPSDSSKVASQTLFAEKIQVKERRGEWCFIVTPDGYEGWIHSKAIAEVDKPYEPTTKITQLVAPIFDREDTEYGDIIRLPYGARVQIIDESKPRWIKIQLPNGMVCYIQRGDLTPEPVLHTKADLVEFSQKFLGLPYTWGGRTGFGYDCSGFVQML